MANLPKGEFNMPPGVSTRDIPGNEPKKKSNLCRWAYDDIYDNYESFTTQVLVASIRNPVHITESARMGAHVATCPPSVIRQLYNHPLTDKGLAAFVDDWKKTGQSIL